MQAIARVNGNTEYTSQFIFEDERQGEGEDLGGLPEAEEQRALLNGENEASEIVEDAEAQRGENDNLVIRHQISDN